MCVYNLGCGIINVLDYDEQYIVTFPNGYGRSILTVPWIELGGNVSITCPKTKYSCNIEFLVKPFYGTKKNKITGEILGPDEKRIASVMGEWNGLMEIKYGEKVYNFLCIPLTRENFKFCRNQTF